MTQALHATDFAKRLQALQAGSRVAVALSGGADSLALLVLTAQWAAKSKSRSVVAYTVDHGLRNEAAAEARTCARICKALGVPHRILRWRGAKPTSGIQAAARVARYALLTDACMADSVQSLLVAHHMEDQAETFLMRLARGSGIDGLAAMSASRVLVGGDAPLKLLRPVLDVPRATLRAVVAKAGLTPIEDPSNDNPRYDRVKARRLLADLSALGLSPQRLADTALHMSRARVALDAVTDQLLAAATLTHPTGYIVADMALLMRAPEEIGLRALADMLQAVNGHDYAPRFDALSDLYHALVRGELTRGRTLNGCKLVTKGAKLFVMREASAAAKADVIILKPGETRLWDGRFRVTLARAPKRARALSVQALGSKGLQILRAAGVCEPDAPKNLYPTLPGLFQGARLVAAAHFGPLDPAFEFSGIMAPRWIAP